MAKIVDIESREAKWGEKMIEIKLRFFTNDIPTAEPGKIIPKHAWTSGVVRIQRNRAHGIVPSGDPRPFNSLLDVGAAIEKVLIEYGVILHPESKMRKYFCVD